MKSPDTGVLYFVCKSSMFLSPQFRPRCIIHSFPFFSKFYLNLLPFLCHLEDVCLFKMTLYFRSNLEVLWDFGLYFNFVSFNFRLLLPQGWVFILADYIYCAKPEIAFTGDTMSDFILDEANIDVLRARILVMEVKTSFCWKLQLWKWLSWLFMLNAMLSRHNVMTGFLSCFLSSLMQIMKKFWLIIYKIMKT